jgi:hypothetical protein
MMQRFMTSLKLGSRPIKMRGRKPGFHMSDEHRTKIANAQVLNRLIDHHLGRLELSKTQVDVGLALLRKVLPDLSQVEVSGEQEIRHTIMPTIPSPEEWEAEHANEVSH